MVRASGAMMTGWIFLWITTLAASALITLLVRRYAIKTHLLDLPNHRSSHTQPTPRGGGIGIVSASLLAAFALYLIDAIDANLALAFIGGGIAIAGVGFADDRRPVPVRIRLPIHIGAAVWATYWLGGLPPLQFGVGTTDLGFAGDALSVIAIVWVLNLFNFMDGIDGLAGSEAAFITLTASGFLYYLGLQPGLAALSGSVGMASLGFLIWNWPPAKIFMGDVGSGFLGYAIGVLALADARIHPVAVPVWLILGALFFLDATITLVRRLLRGERPHEAHRSHGYQWLMRRWRSHSRVTRAALALNVVWLLPCAALVIAYPSWAGWLVVAALLPVAAILGKIGAGRAEGP